MTTFTVSPHPRGEFEPSPRWVRVYFNGQLIADSRNMMLLRENERLPLYYFPKHDVRMDCLEPSDHTTDAGPKGEGVFWHLKVGGKVADNAAFTFRDPAADGLDLEDHVAFKWNEMDAWFEEDEEVFVYARDPYKRVDVVQSSRHIKVVVDGTTIAESNRPRLLFETGLPTRYYVPKHDARRDLLEPSDTVTRCPYKGEANFHSIRIGGKLHRDLAWTYPYPMRECLKIQGFLVSSTKRSTSTRMTRSCPDPKRPGRRIQAACSPGYTPGEVLFKQQVAPGQAGAGLRSMGTTTESGLPTTSISNYKVVSFVGQVMSDGHGKFQNSRHQPYQFHGLRPGLVPLVFS